MVSRPCVYCGSTSHSTGYCSKACGFCSGNHKKKDCPILSTKKDKDWPYKGERPGLACFPLKTQVPLHFGKTKDIEQIKVGDRVWDGTSSGASVLAVNFSSTDKMTKNLSLYFPYLWGRLEVTESQRLLLEDRSWRRVDELKIGDKLYGNIEVRQISEGKTQPVCYLTVERGVYYVTPHEGHCVNIAVHGSDDDAPEKEEVTDLEPMLAATHYIIEASDYEVQSIYNKLWKNKEGEPVVIQEIPGQLFLCLRSASVIGNIIAKLCWFSVDGHKVMFWRPASRAFDFQAMKEWRQALGVDSCKASEFSKVLSLEEAANK